MKLGAICKVQHRQTFQKGRVSLVKCKPQYIPISLVYLDGGVKVEGSEDLWDVAPSKDSRAEFETVPLAKQD